MKNLRIYIWMGLVLFANVIVAAPHYSTSRVTHWLGISAIGMETNSLFAKQAQAYPTMGGGGQATLLYEIHKGHFFFNIGLGADYTVTTSVLDTYSDEFNRIDYTGEEVVYRYVYSNYQEQQSQLRVVVPIQFGYRFGDWFYMGLGTAFRTQPLLNAFLTNTRMLTEGEYDRFVQPIRNAPDYGYWQENVYVGEGIVKSATHEMALELELGARIPLARGAQMRIGAFLGYDIPLFSYNKRPIIPLVDYSNIDTNPITQSMENLVQNIRFNSLLDTSISQQDVQRLRAGLRLTFIFNVTRTSMPCMCETD